MLGIFFKVKTRSVKNVICDKKNNETTRKPFILLWEPRQQNTSSLQVCSAMLSSVTNLSYRIVSR